MLRGSILRVGEPCHQSQQHQIHVFDLMRRALVYTLHVRSRISFATKCEEDPFWKNTSVYRIMQVPDDLQISPDSDEDTGTQIY